MGCDIHGAIEMRSEHAEAWQKHSNIKDYADRHYSAFGALFGVRNFTGLSPLWADREIPDDASPEVESYIEKMREKGHLGKPDCHARTHVYAEEIYKQNWDSVTGEVFYTASTKDGQNERKVSEDNLRYDGHTFLDDHQEALDAGVPVELPDELSKRVVLDFPEQAYIKKYIYTYKTALDEDWKQLLFNIVPKLYQQRDRQSDQVRLVVWFDN